jgi:hypothetical protein
MNENGNGLASEEMGESIAATKSTIGPLIKALSPKREKEIADESIDQ